MVCSNQRASRRFSTTIAAEGAIASTAAADDGVVAVVLNQLCRYRLHELVEHLHEDSATLDGEAGSKRRTYLAAWF